MNNTHYMVMVNGSPAGLPYVSFAAADRLAKEWLQRDPAANVWVEGLHGGKAPVTVYRYGPLDTPDDPALA